MRSELSQAGRLAIALLVLTGCQGANLHLGDGKSRAGTGAAAGMGDAAGMGAAAGMSAVDGGSSEDAGLAIPTFGEPQVIAELSVGDKPDDDPSLSEDSLVLCFNSKREGGQGKEDIWCAGRSRTDEPWSEPQRLTALNSAERETGVALSADGLKLWFSSDRDGSSGGLDVYASSRESRDADWTVPERIAELSTEGDDLVSSIDGTGRTLVLSRRDDDDDDYDIYTATRTSPYEHWQPPVPIAEVNSDAEESDGFLVGSGLELIFTRDEDLVLARRAQLDAPFDRGEPLTALNSEHDDRDAWADSMLSYVVFSSDRSGSYHLYEASRL